MKIAVASGKGGTGKTTVATNLAFVASRDGRSVAYLDCDVEGPNGAIFLKPEILEDRPIFLPIPEVDADKCTGCGLCGKICQYSAIISIERTVLTFPELCHGCGGCVLVCPTGAISEQQRQIGRVQVGRAGKVRFVQGLLDIGRAMSPPLIRAVKAAVPQVELQIIDCPPGTSCPVIAAVKGADYVLLVTEPTPFGLHDLELAVQTVRQLRLPLGVVINRCDIGDSRTEGFCISHGIPILARMAHLREVAEAYSRGILAAEISEGHCRLFEGLFQIACKELAR